MQKANKKAVDFYLRLFDLCKKCYLNKCGASKRSSSNSLRVLSILPHENSSVSKPLIRSYLPFAHVTGASYITPSGIP